jgi:hypothetical protein
VPVLAVDLDQEAARALLHQHANRGRQVRGSLQPTINRALAAG